ncbi:unnamed protein product, partial [marine sediment metagenome]
ATYSCTRNGTSINLFRNGEEVTYDTKGSHTDPLPSTSNFTIGKYEPSVLNFHFNGRIDEFASWDRYLTPTEIQDLYNVTKEFKVNFTVDNIPDGKYIWNVPAR